MNCFFLFAAPSDTECITVGGEIPLGPNSMHVRALMADRTRLYKKAEWFATGATCVDFEAARYFEVRTIFDAIALQIGFGHDRDLLE